MSNQYLKLRRSNVQGRIPTTESIDFGEIALNTYDGLAYMKKSGSSGIEVVPIGSNSGSFSGSFTGIFTGSLQGTASWAQNALYAPNIYNTDGILTGNRSVDISNYQLNIGSGSYRNLEINNANNTGSVVVRNSLYISVAPSGSTLPPSYISGSEKFQQLIIEAVSRDNPSERVRIKAGGWHTSTWFGAEAMDNWIGVNPGVGSAGIQNDAFGFRTLGKLTTGFNNTAFGGWALGDTTTGTRNVAVGLDALWRNVVGSRNTGIGNLAGMDNISGSRNIYIGDEAGRGILSGSNNIIIGTQTGLPAGLSDNIIISIGAGTTRARSFETGNWLFQNGGVFVDSGFRLDVNGSTRFGSSNQMTVQSTGQVDMKNGLTVTGSLNAPSITGSLQGTASWAVSSSRALQATSASYSVSASHAESSSYALSASHASVASSVTTLNQNVTISGSLTVTDNFTVLGSASITYISESTLNIGTNLITVNTINPGARFGGLSVIDSGSSPQISASFLYDSIKDEFVFVHHSIPTTSSVFLQGPETYNDLGNEIYLTQNRIPKGTGIEHLNDSNISDDGSVVSINSNTQITGSLIVSNGITGSFSGSGANLFDIPASGIVGLNLSQISSGSVSASISPDSGFRVNTNTTISGSLTVNGVTDGTGSGHVIMYNTSSGQFFYTASSAIGGGNASNDNFQQIFLLMGG